MLGAWRVAVKDISRLCLTKSTFVSGNNSSCLLRNVTYRPFHNLSQRNNSKLGNIMSSKSPPKSQTQASRKLNTGGGTGPGSKTSPKNKQDVTTHGTRTRSQLYEEETKEKERYEQMTIDEKRKLYKCGDKYMELKNVPDWIEHAKSTEAVAASPKKIKKTGVKEEKHEKYAAKDELNKKVSVWRGDITTLEIDAIVNAANNSLLGGGGVDGAIHSASGPMLKRECSKLNGCETGDAKITCGYKLPAKHVIHTVGPIGEGTKDLKSCYVESLNRMKENKLTSIAFPCISTGIYGFPNEKAAPLAIKTVREFLEKDEYGPKVERVIFCLFMPVDVSLYNEWMKRVFPLEEGDSPDESGTQDETLKKKNGDHKETDMDVEAESNKKDSPKEKSLQNENDVEMEDSKNSTSEGKMEEDRKEKTTTASSDKESGEGGDSKPDSDRKQDDKLVKKDNSCKDESGDGVSPKKEEDRKEKKEQIQQAQCRL